MSADPRLRALADMRAFPMENASGKYANGYPEPGLSIRMHIAIAAMQGMLAANHWFDGIAPLSFQIADAMIAEALKERQQ